MSEIKYIFEPEKGKLYDFFAVLNLSTRCERMEDLFESIGLKVHEDISAAYLRIYSYIKKSSRGIKLFFNTGEKGESFFFKLFSDDLVSLASIEDILNKFRSFTPVEIAVKLLSFYDSKNVFSDTFYRLVIQNRQLLVEFLNGLNLSPEIKWDLLNFLEYPEDIISDLYKFFEGVAGEIEEEYKENQKLLQDYYNKVESNFNKDGKLFLINKVENYRNILKAGNYTTVRFAVSMFMPFTMQYINSNRTLNVYLGHNYEEGLQIAREIKTDNTVLFKSFTDNTRLRIIELLKQNKELYAVEISEILKMPMSSLAHHLDILCTSNLVERRNEGKRTYYKLKLEAVFTAIQLLNKIAS